MYISKNKSLSGHLKTRTKEEFISELKREGHVWAILQSEKGRSVTVYYISSDLTPRADFVSAKEAIKVFSPLENPTMLNDGYTIVRLKEDLAAVIYYNMYEPDIENSPNIGDFMKYMGFKLSEYAYKLGETGITVCLLVKITEDLIHEEIETINRINSMCEESLDPETMEKWDQVRKAIIETRKAFTEK